MGRDPDLYESPDMYIPDRFMKRGPQDSEEQPGFRSTRTFGFGRRVCPGRHLAESMVFIHVSSLLAAFNISKPTDPDGRVVEPIIDFVEGLIT